MTGIMQSFVSATYIAPIPPWPVSNIGDAYGGGFFAGQINLSGTYYNLVVSPKATGQTIGSWSSSVTFCDNLTTGGYSDWYLPSKNELEVMYYFLKPTTNANNTASGSNANAVSPEPVSTNYTSGSPAQTSVTAFQSGNSEAFASDGFQYWTSTEVTSTAVFYQDFLNGNQGYQNKTNDAYARAIRRVAA